VRHIALESDTTYFWQLALGGGDWDEDLARIEARATVGGPVLWTLDRASPRNQYGRLRRGEVQGAWAAGPKRLGVEERFRT